jgi:hypothetical protein
MVQQLFLPILKLKMSRPAHRTTVVWIQEQRYGKNPYCASQHETVVFPSKEKADPAPARAVSGNITSPFVYGHTKLKTPVLV